MTYISSSNSTFGIMGKTTKKSFFYNLARQAVVYAHHFGNVSTPPLLTAVVWRNAIFSSSQRRRLDPLQIRGNPPILGVSRGLLRTHSPRLFLLLCSKGAMRRRTIFFYHSFHLFFFSKITILVYIDFVLPSEWSWWLVIEGGGKKREDCINYCDPRVEKMARLQFVSNFHRTLWSS
jgi:hypothetical protein